MREPRDTILLSEYLIPANPIPDTKRSSMRDSGEPEKKHSTFASAEITAETENSSFRSIRR